MSAPIAVASSRSCHRAHLSLRDSLRASARSFITPIDAGAIHCPHHLEDHGDDLAERDRGCARSCRWTGSRTTVRDPGNQPRLRRAAVVAVPEVLSGSSYRGGCTRRRLACTDSAATHRARSDARSTQARSRQPEPEQPRFPISGDSGSTSGPPCVQATRETRHARRRSGICRPGATPSRIKTSTPH